MAREHHVPLFHTRLVKERIKTLDPSLYRTHQKDIAGWLGMLRRGDLDHFNEVSLHGEFLRGVFGDILGYVTAARSQEGRFELAAESQIGGGRADGAIGLFTAQPADPRSKSRKSGQVIAPIELKSASQFLEHAKGRSLTPIQQGWDYANQTPESRWIIVSNYRETRLYAKSHGQAAYELFRLEELATQDGFLRFVALLGRDALLGGPSVDKSPLCQMLLASERTEREITARLYAKYHELRVRLFADLRHRHSNIPADTLLGYAQTILDRVLFLAFAGKRNLVPENTLARAYEHDDPFFPRPVWQNFLAVFRGVDQGSAQLDIPLYDGGLFRDLPELADLEVSDACCAAFRDLGDYDFAEDVSVEVLGHIFEQSIADLEQLRREAAAGPQSATTPPVPTTGTQKAPSKRKKEGIFYTPPFITSYLVRQTLGLVMAEAWERSGAAAAKKKDERIAGWEAYRSQLRLIRVLDPACGSGAFLIAAFDALAQEFARVNRALAELRGEYGQTSLFDLTRTVLNENLFGIDKSAESVEITKLSLWLKTAERGKRLTFLDRNIRHGNSVVSDPQVDPWAFDWKAGQVARSFLEPEAQGQADSKAIAARWREGFDVVLGNPPYVRHELLLAKYKEHFRHEFQVFDGVADLFVYFFERGIQQLKVGGRLGFIVSNKWLRGGYADKLRQHLAKTCTLESIIDFGHAPIFPDADAFPCILTLRKLPPAPDHAVQATQYPRDELGHDKLPSYIESHQFPLPQSQLPPAGWTLEPPGVQALLAKLRRNGVPLSEYAGVKPYRGVLTGCNEAFLIDQATKDKLCQHDPRSAELLKKYLRGQDISRWAAQWASLWLVLLKSSGDHKWPWSEVQDEAHAEGLFASALPALYRHLKPLESRLRRRTDRGRFWWELRSCAYYEAFKKPKLIYQEIQFHPAYAVDRVGYFLNNKGFLLPSEDAWLVAVLNSPAMWWHNWRFLVHLKDEALTPAGDKIVQVPIPKPSGTQREVADASVQALSGLTQSIQESTAAVLDVLRMEYGVESPGQALADFAGLGSDGFVREVKKRREKGAPALSPAGLKDLRKLFDSEAPALLEKQSQILAQEATLADTVHAAYQLTREDLALLRATQPPRMPPGWAAS